MKTQVIGIVGGIGAGKSTIVSLLKESIPSFVIGADEIGHHLLQKEGAAYGPVVDTFGTDILDEEGHIVRARLGHIVFNDKKKLKLLNEITHPLILAEVKKEIAWCKEQKQWDLIIIDAALLIEIGLVTLANFIIGVYANEDVRIERIMKREGLSKEAVENRINKQKKWEELEKISNVVVNNNGDYLTTKSEVECLITNLKANVY